MSTRPTQIRDRYLRDGLPVRIGGIAANLARIRSFSEDTESCGIVEELIVETQHFINWATLDPEVESNTSTELTALSEEMSRWLQICKDTWSYDEQRAYLSRKAGEYSDRVIGLSGLLSGKA